MHYLASQTVWTAEEMNIVAVYHSNEGYAHTDQSLADSSYCMARKNSNEIAYYRIYEVIKEENVTK